MSGLALPWLVWIRTLSTAVAFGSQVNSKYPRTGFVHGVAKSPLVLGCKVACGDKRLQLETEGTMEDTNSNAPGYVKHIQCQTRDWQETALSMNM